MRSSSSFVRRLSFLLAICAPRPSAAADAPMPHAFSARRGELVVWVSEMDHEPAAGVTVRVEQVSHEFLFGTRIREDLFRSQSGAAGASYRQVIRSHFNAVATGPLLTWRYTQPSETTYRWAPAETVLAWCAEQQMPALGEQILSPQDLPGWTAALDAGALYEAVARFCETLGMNTRLQVAYYEIPAAPLAESNNRLYHKAAEALLAANPSARLCIGEDAALDNPERYADMAALAKKLQGEGLSPGAICVHATAPESVNPDRIRACLDRLAESELPVFITQISLGRKKPVDVVSSLVLLLTTLFEHPATAGIFFEDLLPPEDEPDRASLYHVDLTPTECGLAYQHLYDHEWRTHTEGCTDTIGRFSCSAYFGQYRVSAVSPDGRRVETTITLSRQMGRETATLHLPARPVPSSPPPAPRGRRPARPAASDLNTPVPLF